VWLFNSKKQKEPACNILLEEERKEERDSYLKRAKLISTYIRER